MPYFVLDVLIADLDILNTLILTDKLLYGLFALGRNGSRLRPLCLVFTVTVQELKDCPL